MSPGDFRAWTSMQIGGVFYDVWDGPNVNHVVYTPRFPNIRDVVALTTSLQGDRLNATVTLHNFENVPIYYDYLGLPARFASNNTNE